MRPNKNRVAAAASPRFVTGRSARRTCVIQRQKPVLREMPALAVELQVRGHERRQEELEVELELGRRHVQPRHRRRAEPRAVGRVRPVRPRAPRGIVEELRLRRAPRGGLEPPEELRAARGRREEGRRVRRVPAPDRSSTTVFDDFPQRRPSSARRRPVSMTLCGVGTAGYGNARADEFRSAAVHVRRDRADVAAGQRERVVEDDRPLVLEPRRYSQREARARDAVDLRRADPARGRRAIASGARGPRRRREGRSRRISPRGRARSP